MTAICVDVLFQQKSIKNLVDISSRVSDTTDCEDSAARPDGIPIPWDFPFPHHLAPSAVSDESEAN